MKTKVSENGVLIPKDLLTGITEVDIRKQNGVIIVIPVGKDDPIYDIGKEPVVCGVSDASENLDKYLYGGE
jgi:virulence-associated protein VagC